MDISCFEAMMSEIVELINESREIPVSEEFVELLSQSIREKYRLLIGDYGLDEFYCVMREEFRDDHELYILVLSVLYYVADAKEHIFEIHRILGEGKIDFLASLNIRTQLERRIFLDSKIPDTYCVRRELHYKLLQRFEALLQVDMKPIPLKERNQKQIVLVTNQLLIYLHAPTRIVIEIAAELQLLGYEVFLLVAYEEMQENRSMQLWYRPEKMNYVKEYNGNFCLEHRNQKIKGYQYCISDKTLDYTKVVLTEIAGMKPGLVWYIGNLCFLADMLRKVTTVVSMPCSDGYAISEAQILMNYMNSGSSDVKAAEKYIKEKGQSTMHMDLAFTYDKSEKTYTRSMFHIPEDSFAITIVGNRLDEEITPEFLDVLNQLLNIDDNIVIVFIGVYNSYNLRMKHAAAENRAFNLGFQNDLTDVLGLMDLFVNPKRRGAGGGAARALSVGVPVVTLGYCDVANASGEEFVCRDYEEMVSLVAKYYSDKSFYLSQSRIGLDRTSVTCDLSKNLMTVIDTIYTI